MVRKFKTVWKYKFSDGFDQIVYKFIDGLFFGIIDSKKKWWQKSHGLKKYILIMDGLKKRFRKWKFSEGFDQTVYKFTFSDGLFQTVWKFIG